MAKTRRKTREAKNLPKVRASGTATQAVPLWERVPRPWQHAAALFLLFAVALGFFAPVTIGNYTVMGGDTVQWRGMAQAMFEYEDETGNRALWSTNGFSGMPGYLIHYPKEVPQIDVVPATLRRAGLWPFAHFLVLLLGVYCLVMYLVREPLAGVLAAAAFGLTTYIPIILAAGHNTKFVALAYAPWLVLAFLYALDRPPGSGWSRTLVATALFAVALAVNLRADHVQITYYVVIALGFVWLVYGVYAVRDGTLRPFLVATAMLAVGAVFATLMVAQPYMAVAEYKAFTIRGAGGNGLDWDYATRWSQGIGELVTLLIPNAYGGDGATYWGPKPFTAGPHYFGPTVLLLAGLALAGIKRRVFLGFGIATAFMVLLSLGEHFPILKRAMLQFVPLYDSFRVPETWLAIVALTVAILAGAGLYLLGRREATPEAAERKTMAAFVGVGVLFALLLVFLVGRDIIFSFEAPDEFAQISASISAQSGVDEDDPRVRQAALAYIAEIREERRDLFTSDAVRTLIFIVLGGGLIILHRRRRYASWILQFGLILLVVIDLWQVDRRYFNTDHHAVRTPAQVQRAIPEYGFDRYIRAQVDVAGGPGHFRTLPLALNPFNDGRSAYFYESVGGYHGAKLALYQDYIDNLVFRPDGSLHPPGLDLTGTRFVISRTPLPGMEVAFEDRETGLLVLERPDALPRAWFVNRVEEVATDAEAIRRLQADRVDLRRVAFVRERPPELPAATPEGASSVRLVRHSPREILWEVETDHPRLLVLSEVYYPAGWYAWIGQEEAEIHRANHLLRSIVVPQGRHLITMRFQPTVHRESVLLAATATSLVYLALLLLFGLAWYRRGAHS
jgi:hypothetical protein